MTVRGHSADKPSSALISALTAICLFFDVSSAIAVLVVEDEADPTKATFLSVAEDGGETWIATSIFGPISGVEIGSDTISFANVMVPQSGTTTPEHLVLDGSLTRGTQVDVESAGVSSIKSQYSSAQR